MSNSIRGILNRVKEKVAWAEFFALLIPIFEALFAKILEQCVTTEEEAVDMLINPSPSQMRYMHFRIRLGMRREMRVRDIPRRQRSARAWDVVHKVIEEANEDPDAVAAAFKEVRG